MEGRRELCLEAVSARSPPRNAANGIGAANPWLCLALVVILRPIQGLGSTSGCFWELKIYGWPASVSPVYRCLLSINVSRSHAVSRQGVVSSALPRSETRPFAAEWGPRPSVTQSQPYEGDPPVFVY